MHANFILRKVWIAYGGFLRAQGTDHFCSFRVLQERKIEPLGAKKSIDINVRVVSATHQDLEKQVEAGKFRQDLYFRLNGVTIRIPPLRERKEMIPRLVELFLHTFSRKQKKSLTGFTPEAEFVLSRHRYPGNIRELQNIIEYATILANPPTITVHDLPDYLQAIPGITDQRLPALTIGWELNESAERVREGFFVGEDITLESMELRYMQYILEKCGDNHSEAARILGISRSTLWRKLKGESHEQS